MAVTVREEVMNEFFKKVFVEGILEKPMIYHIFSGPERGDFHDHPFSIWATVLRGWYDEEVRSAKSSEVHWNRRQEGERFLIKPTHIHRIVDMHPEGCVTQVSYGPWRRTPGFWQFRKDGPYFREWNVEEWRKITQENLK